MQIVHEPLETARALGALLSRLGKDVAPAPAQVRWRGRLQEMELHWCERYRFWFAARQTGNRHWLLFGLRPPEEAVRQEPVCELSFPLAGPDRRMNGMFLRFGKDVLLAWGLRAGVKGLSLGQYLEMHEYGFTGLSVAFPDGRPREAVVISSVSGDNLSCNVARFVSAVCDFKQWSTQGLLPGALPRVAYGPAAKPHGHDDKAAPRLLRLVASGLREQLERFIETRRLRMKVGFSTQGELVLASQDNTVLAVFHAETDLAPENLHRAVGQLILSRQALRAARFLVLPGTLGAYFSQTLFRHDIHVLTYKLTQDMAVVLDAEAVFNAIRIAD